MFFCILIFYTTILLNLSINFNSVLLDFLKFYMYKIMLPENERIFLFSFLTWMPYFPCSCLIALARILEIMLNRSGENRHSYLASDLRKKTIKYDVSYEIFVYVLYQVEEVLFHVWFVGSFYWKRIWDFVKGFMCFLR